MNTWRNTARQGRFAESNDVKPLLPRHAHGSMYLMVLAIVAEKKKKRRRK